MRRSTVVRNAQIIERFHLSGEVPKDIYLSMSLSSVDVVYDALRPQKVRAVLRVSPKLAKQMRRTR
jgi:hypothetical protein